MAKLVSDRTAGRIMALLERADLGRGRRGGGAARWAFVRCDSGTAAGDTGALAECYPATILLPSADSTCPPEDGGAALLTLLTDAGAAAEPTEGAVYACLIAGEVFADRTGAGPDAENGRCRAFGLAPPDAGVSGSGTDNRVARWNGTSAIQSSGVIISDNHQLQVTDPTTGTSLLTLVPATTTSLEYPYLSMNLAVPFGDTLWARFYLSDEYVGAALPHGHHFLIGYNGSDSAAVAITASYAVTRGFRSGPTIHVGVDGTLAPGMEVKGGIVVSPGSGSFVSTSDPNTFTNSQTFQPESSAGVPVTVQGAESQTANLTEWKNSGGTVLGSMSASGALTAASLNGTYDAGTW